MLVVSLHCLSSILHSIPSPLSCVESTVFALHRKIHRGSSVWGSAADHCPGEPSLCLSPVAVACLPACQLGRFVLLALAFLLHLLIPRAACHGRARRHITRHCNSLVFSSPSPSPSSLIGQGAAKRSDRPGTSLPQPRMYPYPCEPCQ